MPEPTTRERLLETSARLFLERGYASTGVATILEDAGLHPGSLYHHFAGKEELLLGVLERYLAMLRPVLMDPVEAAEPDPLERVFRLLAFYRDWVESSGYLRGCPIGNLALQLGAAASPAARALVELNFERWTDAVAAWIEQGRARLPAGTDARALATFVLTTMEGAILLARSRGSMAPFDAAVGALREHFRLLQRLAGG